MIVSPLRYPGGKAKLFPFFAALIKGNGLFNSRYCEPYAGGGGLAIKLLTAGFVDRIQLNDVDPTIYAFWKAILNYNDEFCRLISESPVTMDEWYRQREIWRAADSDNYVALGFATYFLNRTNRSGIIEGAGPIGGYSQMGQWKLDARLVKPTQIENIRRLGKYARQIDVSNMDAECFIDHVIDDPELLLYLDPPYYVKGHKLYKNFYKHDDHAQIAAKLGKFRSKRWVVSYDDVPQIRKIYDAFNPITYSLNYSAGTKTTGTEVIFLSDVISDPLVPGFCRAA